MKKPRKIRTWLEHGEVGLVDRQQVKVRGKLRNESNESLVDLGVGITEPTRQDALLWWCQEKLETRTNSELEKTRKDNQNATNSKIRKSQKALLIKSGQKRTWQEGC